MEWNGRHRWNRTTKRLDRNASSKLASFTDSQQQVHMRKRTRKAQPLPPLNFCKNHFWIWSLLVRFTCRSFKFYLTQQVKRRQRTGTETRWKLGECKDNNQVLFNYYASGWTKCRGGHRILKRNITWPDFSSCLQKLRCCVDRSKRRSCKGSVVVNHPTNIGKI